MNVTNMEFIVYGIKVTSPIVFLHDLPLKGNYDQILKLHIDSAAEPDEMFSYSTPDVNIHGRDIQLFSNQSFTKARTDIARHWQIKIRDLFTFMWSNNSEDMLIYTGEKLDVVKFSFWLLHTIVPIYLTLKQSSMLLHASGIEIQNEAQLFIAPSFGGKSTLVDYFVSQGDRLLSDDKIRLGGKMNHLMVYPSYPYRRTKRIFETLGVHTDNFSAKAVLLGNIYFLTFVGEDEPCSIEEIKGLMKFEVLKKSYLYEPVSMSKVEMEYLFELVQKSTVYQLYIPKDIEALPNVYEKIVIHISEKAAVS